MKFVMTQSICPEGIEKLKADTNGQVEIIAEDNPDPNNYLDDMKDADALIVRIAKCDAHAIENSPNLKVIGRTGVGYDSVDVKKATELGIPVVITPGANNRSVAEHAVAMMFALSKNLYEGQVETRKGNWEIRGAHKAFELEGKTVGVIGLGAIGSRVANCAIELGMEVYGYDPYISIDAAWNLSSQVHHCVNLNDMLPLCDYITIHVPYLPTTRDTINAQTLALCKDGVKILNYARGELVNTEALLEAMETGKVLADGAQPLVGKELTGMEPYPGFKPRVFLNFLLPVLMIVTVAVSTYVVYKSAKTMEAFLLVVIFMTVSMMLQGIPFKEVMDTLTNGIKGALPAVILLALAYSVNGLSQTMGTANYIISLTQGLLTPHLLPCVIFMVAAVMAFATGSSWGTFAICMPIALPLAFSMSGGEVTQLVVAVFAAVAGGGVFGDHCSPLSDTTILSSMGSASDHLDHVRTQLPYALTCGALAAAAYLVLGFVIG